MAATLLSLIALSSTVPLTTAFVPIPSSTIYSLSYDYSGQNFFNNFQFFSDADPTKGHVDYVDMATANSLGLAGFLKSLDTNATANSTGPIYLGVDYTTNIANSTDWRGRKSVRVSSVQKFNQALIIADVLHMPAPVCGTWPAYWLLGSGAIWPEAGEIDILENVNDATFNKYTLHTSTGIVAANHTGTGMKGRLSISNCDVNAPGQDKNVGCSTFEAAGIKSYGDALNDNNGGVYATLIDELGIRMWFFERSAIPADITAGRPSPPHHSQPTRLKGNETSATILNMNTGVLTNSTWGLPNARFDSPDNGPGAIQKHFRDMQIIINTAFCGDWAGSVWDNNPTCKSLAPTCKEYVSAHPEAFEDVYWAFNGIRVYEPVRGPGTVPFPGGPMGNGTITG
ncbi:hypothetical protein LTR05_006323 [Lithohypha guttulata]|uniref:GH16 domain-containing protein n=1 Tax=Lithohypha guttulata TaxID=1690604 RepID=A0AAN7SYI7_9EURO|nr:hypothetical protein LTR05_006323 [Lithohypha guttulata]